jgi:hypothetical protein
MSSTELFMKMVETNVELCRAIALAIRENKCPPHVYWDAIKASLWESVKGDLGRSEEPAVQYIVACCFEHWVDWETVFNKVVELGEADLAVNPE